MIFFAGLFLLLVLAWLRFVALDREERRTFSADGERVLVADGDTLRVGKRTIRLEGIDAVELKQFCREKDGSVWSCGMRARDAMQALVDKGGLFCTTSGHDRYKRDVARCSVNGVDDLGAVLVDQGWAINEADRDGGYAIEEARAKREARGIWRGEFQQPRIWRDSHAYQPKPVNDQKN
jgi:endonuclease YncB( thermonuclease family)